MVWYTTQIFIIKWDNNLSESFCVTNGVRQGGVLSPKLFNVFIEELSSRLRDAKVGCHMNGISMNHLNYADDAVMLAPSVSALQTLINICDNFANEYDMIYNVKKSLCTAFIPQMYGKMHIPAVMLGAIPLKWVSQHKYLGSVVDTKSHDDADISRQIQAIYARGNQLIRNFKECSKNVKIELFKCYLSNLYCSHLWHSYNATTYRKIKVAYNNVFRMLMGIKRGESISLAFVTTNVHGFNSLIRKSIYGFYIRATKSDNTLVRNIVHSPYFAYNSGIFKKWKQLLFTKLDSL